MPHKIGKIYGPPGCGKTTELLRLIIAAVDRYMPNRIGVVSFTNAAIGEIKGRIAMEHKIDRKLLKNVRTLHSQCFAHVPTRDIADTKTAQFSKDNPRHALKGDLSNPDELSGGYAHTKNNDKYFADMQIFRNQLIPTEKWPTPVQDFHKVWMDWVRENNYIDFTGMLEEVLDRRLKPDIDVLFVDESQDLTPLQHAIVVMWSEDVDHLIYAGDSDQCIYRFSGAIPEVFRDLENTYFKHLEQSYRVPLAQKDLATRIISHIPQDLREIGKYNACEKYGNGEILKTNSPELDMEGTHMILCRCKYQLIPWLDILRSKKLLWHNPYRPDDLGWNPTNTQSWQALAIYYKIFAGHEFTIEELQIMSKKLIAKNNLVRGAKSAIDDLNPKEVIDVSTLPEIGFTSDFLEQNLSIEDTFRFSGKIKLLLEEISGMDDPAGYLNQTPNIIVGTIHSVKGGEADHVWLDTSTPPVVMREIYNNRQAMYDEARVQYVATTRAKKTLGLLRSRTWNPLLKI